METDYVGADPGGTNRLDFSSVTKDGLAIDLTSDSALARQYDSTYRVAATSKLYRLVKTLRAGQAANFQNVTGGGGNDYIVGNASANVLDGGDGNDYIRAGTGDATILGGSGDDALYGGPGNNVLDGGSGTNRLIGGRGSNTFVNVNGGKNIIYKGPGQNTVIG